MRLIPSAAIAAKSASTSAVPCTMVVSGTKRHMGGVVRFSSFANSPCAVSSTPSARWMRYASVLPSPKFVQTPLAELALGKSVAAWT